MGKKRQSSICIHRKEALPMNDKSLYDGIGKIAAGYFLIYFDLNINTVSILPSFIGYFLFMFGSLTSLSGSTHLTKSMGA